MGLVEVASNGVADHFTQLRPCVGLREQGIAKRHVKPEEIFPKGIMTLVRV